MAMIGAGVLLALNPMIKFSIRVAFLATLSLIVACGGKNETPEETGNSKFLGFVGADSLSKEFTFSDDDPIELSLDQSQIEGKIKLSDLITDYRLVSLKNWEGGLIGAVDKILLSDSLVFILDQYTYNSLQVFNLFTGEQVVLLFPTGEGPGEMKSISEFDLDEANRKILIYDNSLAKLLYFSFEGEFLYEMRLPLRAHSFKTFSGDYLLFSSIGDGNDHLGNSGTSDLFLLDSNFNVLNYFKYPKIDQRLSNFIPRDIIRENEGFVTYFPRFSNELIQVDVSNKTLSSILQVDLGAQGLSDEDLNFIGPDFTDERKEDKKFYGFGLHFVTPTWIGMRFNRSGGELQVYYNKGTKEVFSGAKVEFDFEDLIFFSYPMACKGNTCITDLSIGDLRGVDLDIYFEKIGKDGRDFNKIKTFLESVEDFEQPVLLVFTLK
jgi:hypothetical protein